jgi:hypothetical protein
MLLYPVKPSISTYVNLVVHTTNSGPLHNILRLNVSSSSGTRLP